MWIQVSIERKVKTGFSWYGLMAIPTQFEMGVDLLIK